MIRVVLLLVAGLAHALGLWLGLGLLSLSGLRLAVRLRLLVIL